MTSDHLIKPPVFFYLPSTPAHWHAHQSYSRINQVTNHPKKNARPSNKKLVSMVVSFAASEGARLDAMTDETVSTRITVAGKGWLQRAYRGIQPKRGVAGDFLDEKQLQINPNKASIKRCEN